MTRADGSRPDALCFSRNAATDADFFDDPPTRFVASSEWVLSKGYVQAADATFQNPDAPATNATEAVTGSSAGDTVWLMPGTHPISTHLELTKANLKVTGKYLDGDGGAAVLDGQAVTRHFRCSANANGATGCIVENLTLTNGNPGANQNGGSIVLNGRSVIIRDCIFCGNETSRDGGALWVSASGTVVSNCVFRGNKAASNGGAIHTTSAMTITGSSFAGESSATYGSCINVAAAGVSVSGCDFSGLVPKGVGNGQNGVFHINNVGNCTFSDCIATNVSFGAAVSLFFPENGNASILVRQCLLGDASTPGHLVADYKGRTRFENCTILSSSFDNKQNTSGENILVNCILPNADIESSGNFVNILTNCLVKSVAGGTQDCCVMTGNPRFSDPDTGNYSLLYGSPCRDAGVLLNWMTADSKDLAGNPRVVTNGKGLDLAPGALPDIGAFECLSLPAGTVLVVR